MSTKVILVPNGEAVFAVPLDVCKKYVVEGESLKELEIALEDAEPDVEGQMELYNSGLNKSENGRYWTTWEANADMDSVNVSWTMSF
ncbi:MAG: hypothetical protein KAU21_03040 [Gammaproteobacteria bacterium]|nr:hypothetical protein [Gammaproteobacteria bacterium]